MTATFCALVTILLLGCGFESSTGSDILFTGVPDVIHTNLTPDLKLHCGLNDSASGGDAAIIGRRDVTHTDDDVLFVTSVVITRDGGEHVASVTQVTPAQALVDQDSLVVTGAVSGHPGQRAFLELHWNLPTDGQSGNYVCEINAITGDGHGVVFSQPLEVNYGEPTLTDLVNYIRDLSVSTNQKDNQLMALLNDKDKVLVNITSLLNDKDKQIADIMDKLNTSRVHVENGTAACGYSTSWPYVSGSYRYKYVDVHFDTKYNDDDIPVVHLGVSDFRNRHHPNMTYATDYGVDLVRVDEGGFRIKCKTYSRDPYNRIYTMNVDWISISDAQH